MKAIQLLNILHKPILTSRQSARRIKPVLSQQPPFPGNSVCLDFIGTHGVSPSFVDEALRVAEEYVSDSGRRNATVVFAHIPTKTSSSHHAIARAHGRMLVVNEAGDWEFRKL